MTQAIFRQEGDAIDYTPGSAVTGGDVVVQNLLPGMARADIAASALGSLGIDGVFEFLKDSSTFAVGQKVYWDDANDQATRNSYGNTCLGICIKSAATGVATVHCLVVPGLVSNLIYSAI